MLCSEQIKMMMMMMMMMMIWFIDVKNTCTYEGQEIRYFHLKKCSVNCIALFECINFAMYFP